MLFNISKMRDLKRFLALSVVSITSVWDNWVPEIPLAAFDMQLMPRTLNPQ